MHDRRNWATTVPQNLPSLSRLRKIDPILACDLPRGVIGDYANDFSANVICLTRGPVRPGLSRRGRSNSLTDADAIDRSLKCERSTQSGPKTVLRTWRSRTSESAMSEVEFDLMLDAVRT